MSVNGLLTEVRWEWDGTELTADASAVDTVLSVLDYEAVTVDEQVWIGESGPYTVTDIDEDTDTITITPGLDDDYEEGTEVVPDVGGQPAQVWVAEVALPDSDTPIEVPLTIKDLSVMPEGEYDSVAIILSDDLRSVVDLPGSLPVVNGVYIPPDTVPDPISPTEVPALSPAIVTVTGLTSALMVETEDVDFGTVIDYHISETEGFTPDSSTLYTSSQSPVMAIYNLANGDPLSSGVSYFLRTMAHNSLGYSPTASAEVVGALDLRNVDNLVAARLVAGFILAGKIEVGLIEIDADLGIIVRGPGGSELMRIPSDGSPIEATMQIITDRLNVLDNLSIKGNAQLVGNLQLADGISNPDVEATVGSRWETQAVIDGNDPGAVDFTPFWNGAVEWHSGTTDWAQCITFFGAIIRKHNKTTGIWGGDLALGSWKNDFYPYGGIARIGTNYYLCGQDLANDGDWYVIKVDATTGNKTASVYLADAGIYSATYRPGIAADGTNVYFFAVGSGKNLRVKSWNSNLGAESGWTTLESYDTRYSIADCWVGDIDGIGSNRLWVAFRNGPGEVLASFSGGAPSTYGFKKPQSLPIGMFYDTTLNQMVTIGGDGSYILHGKYPLPMTAKVKYAPLDDNATGGTHETMPSPEEVITLPARKWLTASVPPPPDINNSDPTNTDKANKVAVYLTVDNWVTTARVVFDGTEDWGDTWQTLVGLASGTPKVVNEFDSSTLATPGEITSTATDGTDPLIDLKGDGSWRMYPLSSERCFARRYRTGNLAIGSGSTVNVPWGNSTEETGITYATDLGGGSDAGWEIVTPGIYTAECTVKLTAGSLTGRFRLDMYVNGTSRLSYERNFNNNANDTFNVCGMLPLAEGDEVTVWFFTNTGSGCTLEGAVSDAASQKMHAMIGLIGS